jgi:hypothetical protein
MSLCPPPTSPTRKGNSSSGSSPKREISLSEYQPGFSHLSLKAHVDHSRDWRQLVQFPSEFLGYVGQPLSLAYSSANATSP